MRKRFFFILLTCSAAGVIFAQEDYTAKPEKKDPGEIKTLFAKGKHGKAHIGYFIGPEFAYTQFTGNKDVFLLGLSAGITVNRFLTLGLTGYGIVNSSQLLYKDLVFDSADMKYKDCNLFGGYGGINVEFTVLPKAPVHVTFPVMIGLGGLTYLYLPDNQDYQYNWGNETIYWDLFFVVQPGIRVEFNVVRFFRIGVGASYRYTPDLDLINTTSSAINQFNFNLSLKFGKF